jgi:membrane carboxypeptidase/penicillin-binding protein
MYILKVVDRDGKVLEQHEPTAQSVISPDIAYLVTDLLLAVMEPGGTGSHLKATVGRPVAGKTGTTDDYKDAWMLGYTPELACAVWVGFDKERTVDLAGGTIAGPIWAEFLKNALAPRPVRNFSPPATITSTTVCMDTGLIAVESCPRRMTMRFLPGTEPEYICWQHARFWYDPDWEGWSEPEPETAPPDDEAEVPGGFDWLDWFR